MTSISPIFFFFFYGGTGASVHSRDKKFHRKKKGKFTQSWLTASSIARSLEQKPFFTVFGTRTRIVRVAGVWAHARPGRKGPLILEIGHDAIQSLDTQLRPRVRSNRKTGFSGFKNPYFGFAILTMTKSKHQKTDFNAEKSLVGFPFSPVFSSGE